MQQAVETGAAGPVVPAADAPVMSQVGVSRFGAALLAAVLGSVMLYGVGFAQIDAVHNAAHDTRHAVAFPCH